MFTPNDDNGWFWMEGTKKAFAAFRSVRSGDVEAHRFPETSNHAIANIGMHRDSSLE